MKPYKILELIGHLDVGGAETHVSRLALNLDKAKFKVRVGCVRWAGALASGLTDNSIPVAVFHKKNGVDPSVIKRLAAYMKDEKTEILHTHMFTAGFWGKIAAKIAHVPCIITTEHTLGGVEKPLKHFVPDFLLSRFTDLYIAPSGMVRNTLISKSFYPEKKIIVIKHGINLDRLVPSDKRIIVRTFFDIPMNSVVIGMVGRFSKEKEHWVLLEAFKLIKDSFPDLYLVLVGQGKYEQKIRDKAESLRIMGKTIFMGKLPSEKLVHILSVFDISVLPSSREGFGLALMEAMYLGKPGIAAKNSGAQDIIIHGVTGFLFEQRNPRSLAGFLEQLLRNPEQRKNMGIAAKKWVAVHGTESRMIKETENAIEETYLKKLEE